MNQSESLSAFGEFPPVLYRAFTERQWAKAFVEEGRMRFKLPRCFADLESDPRADSSEGRAHLQVAGPVTTVHLDENFQVVGATEAPGYINYQGEFLNPVYIYCFSYPPHGDPARLPKHLGEHLVRIDDPQQLAQDVTDWLTKEARLRGTPVVECWPVRYDKGERSAEITDHLERTRLNYTQKPRSYETEYEYRFAVVASPDFDGRMGLREYHDVVLGHPLPYAELL